MKKKLISAFITCVSFMGGSVDARPVVIMSGLIDEGGPACTFGGMDINMDINGSSFDIRVTETGNDTVQARCTIDLGSRSPLVFVGDILNCEIRRAGGGVYFGPGHLNVTPQGTINIVCRGEAIRPIPLEN